MWTSLRRLLRHAIYDLRGGFLVRPLALALALGVIGVALSLTERRWPGIDAWADGIAVLAPHDPATAQAMLSTIAGAFMTVVSIVLSVLLVALTLASMQFSPRILTGFVKDRISQHTIGLFLGTFLFCLALYPAARFGPNPAVPVVGVLVALALVLVCVIALLLFIHHIARSINANDIADRIARETERAIDEALPQLLEAPLQPEAPIKEWPSEGQPVLAGASGYVRFIDKELLLSLTKARGTMVRVARRAGHFVPEGAPLLWLASRRKLDPLAEAEFREAFDLGPMRTLEQDVEFGLLQLVDIALKAISPAVNDPSTAINCIDQLSRLLVRIASRRPAPAALYQPPGVLRVTLAPMPFSRLLECAFGQIRHYGKSDVVVSLRLLRALHDIASTTTEPTYLAALARQAERVAAACAADGNLDEVRTRLAAVIRLSERERTPPAETQESHSLPE